MDRGLLMKKVPPGERMWRHRVRHRQKRAIYYAIGESSGDGVAQLYQSQVDIDAALSVPVAFIEYGCYGAGSKWIEL
jgi:hypothetical protein